MKSVPEQIDEARRVLDRLSDELTVDIGRIHADASEKILAAIARSQSHRARLTMRLASLSVAANMIAFEEEVVGDVPVAESEAVPIRGPRKSPSDIIIETLSSTTEPVPSPTLDAVVMAAGWTRSAAEKSKTRLREAGTILRRDRHYTIAEVARRPAEDRPGDE